MINWTNQNTKKKKKSRQQCTQCAAHSDQRTERTIGINVSDDGACHLLVSLQLTERARLLQAKRCHERISAFDETRRHL